MTTRLPLFTTGGAPYPITIERADGGRPEAVPMGASLASPGYFSTMRIPLLSGRTFRSGDLAREAPAIILSASVARRVFAGESPIGRRVRRTDTRRKREFEVIGVAGDVPGARIEDGASSMLYFPVLPDGDGLPKDSFPLPIVARGGQFVIRGEAPPTASAIRDALRRIDTRVPPMQIRPLTDYVQAATARVRLTMLLLAAASGGALLLGVIGIYSVVAYAAAGRRREFGVRLALGATPTRVAGMVWRDGAILAAIGVTAGVGLAALGTRVLRSLLYEVSATSFIEFASAFVVVILVTLIATAVPARRAARTDPAIVLRGE
jgi:hypothetical protein